MHLTSVFCSRFFISASLQVRQSGANSLSIQIGLLSNWGHESRIGLTEIQFFDLKKNRLEIDASLLRVEGAKNELGDVGYLVNNRFKVPNIKCL
jgi:hypothetical protein